MPKTETTELNLRFRVERQDDDDWPWDVSLVSVSPRGTGLKGQRSCPCCLSPGLREDDANVENVEMNSRQSVEIQPPSEDEKIGTRICDACAVEESIKQIGAEEWLESTIPPHVFSPASRRSRSEHCDPERSALKIDREGTIILCGHMVWTWYSGLDGVEWDEEFVVKESFYNPPHGI